MRAKLRDTEIYFDVEGAGLVPEGGACVEKPPAFVIHGGPGGDHSGFKPRFSPLAERLQLVYFDHRGQGRSARGDPAKYTLDENVEDMEALRLHLGLGPIVSIGTSYGGMVAMAHAARYPHSVSHLVLIVTAAHAGFIPRARQIVAERGTTEQKKVCDQLWAGRARYGREAAPLLRRDGAALLARKFDAGWRSKLSRDRGILAPEALNRAFAPGGFLHSYDLRPELAKITAPTLILAGRHDWICPPEFSEEIHRLIPGSDLRIFEDSSHSIRGDEPQKFIDAIAGFLVYQGKSASAP